MNWKAKLGLGMLVNYGLPAVFDRAARRSGKAVALAAGGVGVMLAAKAVARRLGECDLRGKTVLITGGSRGLGLVLAREFVREGARVAICARDSDELDRAREDLRGRGADAFSVPCDLTDRAEVEQMVSIVREQFGEIDVLVNNAGVISVGPMEEMIVADFEEAMSANYWAALYCALAVLPGMRARRQGRIVNIASIGGKLSVPHLLPYSASKFALVGLSEGMRAELAKDGVVVTTVCPGLMRTGSPRHAIFKGQHRAEYAWFSIGDSLPIVSISAERAARKIVAACKRGDAEVILSVPAKLAAVLHSMFPGLTADLMGVVDRFLPAPGGIGERRVRGADSQSKVSPSFFTRLGDRAARNNNEIT